MNQNQKIVLEWLKEEKKQRKELTAFGVLGELFGKCDYDNKMNISSLLLEAMLSFSRKEQFELLAEFAKWGLREGY